MIKFNESHAALFNDVEFVVEANSFEKHVLWTHYGIDLRLSGKFPWHDEDSGKSAQIGTVDGRPVCLSIEYVIINNKRVMFYDAMSQVVDHRLIDEWFSFYSRKDRCGAQNFHHCLAAIGAI